MAVETGLPTDSAAAEPEPGHADVLLSEYAEIGRCWRHDDEVAARLTATLFPLAVGALILPFAYPALPRLVAGLGGMMLMLFWWLYYSRIYARLVLRYQRAKEIEEQLGMQHHLRFDRPGLRSRAPAIQRTRNVIFVFYCAVWAYVLVFCRPASSLAAP